MERYTASQQLDDTASSLDAGGTGSPFAQHKRDYMRHFPKKHSILSVPEVPDARKRHRYAKPVGSLDDLGVAHRATRLNNCRGAGLRDGLQAVGEREKGVGGGNSAIERKNCLHCAKPCGIHPAHLPCANPYRLAVTLAEAGIDDRVRFDVLAHPPGEEQRTRLLHCWLALGNDAKLGLAEAETIGVQPHHTPRHLVEYPWSPRH